jgi:phage terminase large subunit
VETIEINPDLNPVQKKVLKLLLNHKNGITEILFGGGAGGSKTYTGCLWIIIQAIKYPDTRYLIGRKRLTDIRDSVLVTFFNVLKNLNITNEHYTYNASNFSFTFYNGSMVLFKELNTIPGDSEFDRLGSSEYTSAFIDEANQVSEKAKNIVMSRIRYKLDENGLIPKILLSCNPAKGWLYNNFYKPSKDGTILDYRKFVPALSSDNKFISKHYINNLNKLDEVSKQRLLFGEWEYSDSLSLYDYDSIIQMFDGVTDGVSDGVKYITVDPARLGEDKTLIMVWSGLQVIQTRELSKLRTNEVGDVIRELQAKYNVKVSNIAIDSDGVGGGVSDQFKGCIEIINNSKPLKNENYQNLKTQLYFKLIEKLPEIKVTCSDEQEEKLTQELQVVKRTKIDQDGKISMSSKDEIKQMIGRSPDYSDCLAYRMYFEFISYSKPVFMFNI